MSRKASDYKAEVRWGGLSVQPRGKGMGICVGTFTGGLVDMSRNARKYAKYDSGSFRAMADAMDAAEDKKLLDAERDATRPKCEHCGGQVYNLPCYNRETGGLEAAVICVDCHRIVSDEAAEQWKDWYGKHDAAMWAPFEDQADAHDELDELIGAARAVQLGTEADDNVDGYPNMSPDQRLSLRELLGTMERLRPMLERMNGYYLAAEQKGDGE